MQVKKTLLFIPAFIKLKAAANSIPLTNAPDKLNRRLEKFFTKNRGNAPRPVANAAINENNITMIISDINK